MSALEAVLRHACASIGGEPEKWAALLPMVSPCLDKLLALMPADLAEAVRAFLDKEIAP